MAASIGEPFSENVYLAELPLETITTSPSPATTASTAISDVCLEDKSSISFSTIKSFDPIKLGDLQGETTVPTAFA
jgi:hypothetical protein